MVMEVGTAVPAVRLGDRVIPQNHPSRRNAPIISETPRTTTNTPNARRRYGPETRSCSRRKYARVRVKETAKRYNIRASW